MAVIEEALVSLTGPLVGGRVYPAQLKQAPTYPCILYEKVSADRNQGLAGPLGRSRARFRLHCWATSYGAAKALANAVRALLDGYSGSPLSVVVDAIRLDGEFDGFAPQSDVYRVVLDFSVSHEES